MTTDSNASDVEERDFIEIKHEGVIYQAAPYFDWGWHVKAFDVRTRMELWEHTLPSAFIEALARASQQPSAQWQFQCKACALLFSANENVGGALSCPRCLCSTTLPSTPDTERAE